MRGACIKFDAVCRCPGCPSPCTSGGAEAVAANDCCRSATRFSEYKRDCFLGAPDLLRSVCLRLMCDVWEATGKGWPQLSATMNGLFQPGENPGPLIRLARGACVRDICLHDPSCGLDLIPSIQQCATDPSEPVAALALEAIGVLCHHDVLDFYKAWTVVQRWYPRLPDGLLLAEQWVALMAHGGLDAQSYPERAAAIHELLWAASKHPKMQVRSMVYKSLAGYPIDVLDTLEVQRPMCEYVEQMLTESKPEALQSAEDMVGLALAYEHSHRRRVMAAGGRTGGSSNTGFYALKHRLGVVLPQNLCRRLEGWSTKKAAVGTSPSVPIPAGALLLCWKPETDTATRGSPSLKYQELFTTLTGTTSWSCWTHPYLAFYSWKQFLDRWLSTGAGIATVEGALRECWSSGLPPHTGNALGAASILCSTNKVDSTHLSWVRELAEAEIQEGRPTLIRMAAAFALVPAACALHPTDWAGRLEILATLASAMEGAHSGEVEGAAAEAAGWLCWAMMRDAPIENRPDCAAQIYRCITQMLQAVERYLPELGQGIKQIVASLPTEWCGHSGQDEAFEEGRPGKVENEEAAVCGLLMGLHWLSALLLKQGVPDVAERFTDLLMHPLRKGLRTGSDAVLQAFCRSLPISLTTLASCQYIPSSDVWAAVRGLQKILRNTLLSALTRGYAAAGIGHIASCMVGLGLGTQDQQRRVTEELMAQYAAAAGETDLLCGLVLALGQLMGSFPPICDVLGGFQPSMPSVGDPQVSRQVVKLLESATTDDAAPRVSSLAAWVAVSAGVNALSSAADQDHLMSMAVESLPADGALRPLLDALTGHLQSLDSPAQAFGSAGSAQTDEEVSGDTVQSRADRRKSRPKGGVSGKWTVCSIIGCLSRAERLPAGGWVGIIRQMLQVAATLKGSAGDGEEGLAAKMEWNCVQFCLAHGGATHGLSDVLDMLMTDFVFMTAQSETQVLLLDSLPTILSMTSVAHAPSILKAVPKLTLRAKSASGAWSYFVCSCAAWRGVKKAFEDGQSLGLTGQDVGTALAYCASALYKQLPLPDTVLPGDVHGLLLRGQGHRSHHLLGGRGKDPVDKGLWDVWMESTLCMRALGKGRVLEMTQVQGPPVDSLRAVLMRCLLAHQGFLKLDDLGPCRYYCLSSQDAQDGWAVNAVALALGSAPTSVQMELLIETLNAVKVVEHPKRALGLALALAASWQAQQNAWCLCDTHFTLAGPDGATRNGPTVLPGLLSGFSAAAKRRVVDVLMGLVDAWESGQHEGNVEWDAVRETVCADGRRELSRLRQVASSVVSMQVVMLGESSLQIPAVTVKEFIVVCKRA
eukprot:evm.model.scf_1920.1 EVM.evm.TU.scf_1920.1   scf_1920:1132-13661(+)